MKKIGKAVLSCLMAFSLTACSSSQSSSASSGSYNAGTYTGVSENGKGGEVKVEVVFTSDAIDSVTVTEHNETAGISDGAIEQIPASIVENQSLAIDTVSGATITSNAIIEAVADAVEQAGGDAEALQNAAVEKEKSDEQIELNGTVIVVGAGAAGMSAAISAAYEGAEKVLLFEKTGNVGGNALVSGGWIENLAASEDQQVDNNEGYQALIDEVIEEGPQNEGEEALWDQLVEDYNEWKESGAEKVFDSTTYHAIDFGRVESADPRNYIAYSQDLLEFNEWFTGFGAEYNNNTGIVGYSWPRWTSVKGYYSGQGFFYYFNKAIEDNDYPVDIYLNTPVTSLILDEDNKVIGVKAEADSGETYTAYADDVILCTGGFSANTEMLLEYNTMWDKMDENILSTNTSGDTGDGINMAVDAGAGTNLMENEMMFPMANIHTGSTESIVGNSSSALLVNKEGKRFVDESKDRYTISGAEFEQTDGMGYIISDSLNSNITEDGKAGGGEDVETLIANGELYRADTLEELCELTGIDYDNLQETIESYNEMCKTYEDPDFGRTSFAEGSEITTGPFYAYPCVPAAHITIGGITVNEYNQVTTSDGTVIEGLWAAGEVVAGECGIGDGFAIGKKTAQYVVKGTK